MSNIAVLSTGLKPGGERSEQTQAASITRAASKQTYYIVRFLVDRDPVPAAYLARFETVLEAIEQDGFRLRAAYPECKSVRAGLNMGWSMLTRSSPVAVKNKPLGRYWPDKGLGANR